MTAPIHLRLWGTPLIVGGTSRQPLPLERKDAAWLLLLSAQGGASRDRVAGWLWPEVTQKAALLNLRQRIFRLRRKTGHELVAGASQLVLADGVEVPRPGHDDERPAELLGNCAYDDCPEFAQWLVSQRALSRQQWHDAVSQRADALEHAGDLAQALVLAQRLIDSDRLSEHEWRRAMRLHYLRNDRSAAIAVFEVCERELRDELGVRPGHATLALLADIERLPAPTLPRQARIRPVDLPSQLKRPAQTIGREALLQQVQQAWAGGRSIVVEGEAGIGKTRLLEELCVRAGVVCAQARPGDVLSPYALGSRLLRALGSSPGLGLEPLLTANPVNDRAWMALLGPSGTLRAALSSGRLAALAFDDVHLADLASMEWLAHALADEGGGLGLPFIFLRRPSLGPSPDAAAQVLGPLLNEGRLIGASMSSLDPAQTHALVASLQLAPLQAAGPGVLKALSDGVYLRSGGNPLFLLETLRESLLSGLDVDSLAQTVAHPGTDTTAPASAVQAADRAAALLARPTTVAQVLDRRIAQMSPGAASVARVAAMAGPDFSTAMAEAVLALPILRQSDDWNELERAQIFRDGGLAHDLVRDAVLRSIPPVVARHAHRSIAEWLSTEQGQAACSSPARRAEHWRKAGEIDRALADYRLAAVAAGDAGRATEHHQLLMAAAQAAIEVGRWHEALLLRIDATEPLLVAKRPEAALAFADETLALHGEHPGGSLGGCHLARANALVWLGKAEESIEAFRSALVLLPSEDRSRRALALSNLSTALTDSGRQAEAVPVMEQLKELALNVEPPRLRCQLFGALSNHFLAASRAYEALDASTGWLAAARLAGDRYEEAIAQTMRCSAWNLLGRSADVLQELVVIDELLASEPAATGVLQSHFTFYRGLAELGQGLWGEALYTLETLRGELKQEGNVVPALTMIECFLAGAWITLGQPDRARRLLMETPLEHHQARRQCNVQLYLGLAEQALAAHAHRETALKLFERARTSARQFENPSTVMHACLRLAPSLPLTQALECIVDIESECESLGLLTMLALARITHVRVLVLAGDQLAGRLSATEQQRLRQACDAAAAVHRVVRGNQVTQPEGWAELARGYAACAEPTLAADCLQQGRDALLKSVATLPDELRSACLERNPVHRSLLQG